MDRTTTRIPWLDLLKAGGLYLVILGHLCTWQIAEVPPGTPAWDVSNLYNGLCRVAVPLFLMVSGALLLDDVRGPRKAAASLRLAGRYLLTYLVWAVVYALPDWRDLLARPAGLLPALAKGQFHLWYLVMLAGVYLVLPLLYRVTRDPVDTTRALGVTFAATILLPSLAGLPGLAWLGPLTGELYLDSGFLFYLLAGRWLVTRPPVPAVRRALYGLGAAATVWNIAATWVLSRQAGTFSDFWLDQRRVTVALGAMALFAAAQCHGSGAWCARLAPLAGALGRCSLGIYAVHVVFLLALRKFGVSVYALPPVWGLPLLAAAVLLASWASAAVLRRLPVVRRFV